MVDFTVRNVHRDGKLNIIFPYLFSAGSCSEDANIIKADDSADNDVAVLEAAVLAESAEDLISGAFQQTSPWCNLNITNCQCDLFLVSKRL